MSVPFAHGFNDIFHIYAAHPENPGSSSQPGWRDLAFDRAAGCHSSLLRFQCNWDFVQQDSPYQYRWSLPGFYDYEELRTRCIQRRMKILPIITGVPVNWVPRADRAPCNFAPYPSNPADDGNLPWYPLTSTSQTQFGGFAVQVLKFFDVCGAIDAVELWNEPNGGATGIPNWVYPQMVSAVVNQVAMANASGHFSHPMRVVAGSLVMDYSSGSWKNYLNSFDNLPYDFDISIHPYDTPDHPALPANQAADAVVARVSDLYNQAAVETDRQIWVTETGASSRNPFTQAGQGRALKYLVGAAPDGFFQTRARCRAALVHKLWGSDNLPAFQAFPVCEGDAGWTPKDAYYKLMTAWA